MGLSLSLLVAACLLLPGATFVFGLTKLHNPNNPPTPLDPHFSFGLALALLAAVIFQAAWLKFWVWALSVANSPIPDVSQVVALLEGGLKSPQAQAALVSLQTYPVRIAAYFAFLPILTWRIGKEINRHLKARLQASWYELLRPNDKTIAFIWLTADICLGEQCFLIGGWVKEFCVSRDGNLDRVVLGYAVRRQLKGLDDGGRNGSAQLETRSNHDREASNPNQAEQEISDGWIEIDGEFTVLRLKSSSTINVDYIFEELSSTSEAQ